MVVVTVFVVVFVVVVVVVFGLLRNRMNRLRRAWPLDKINAVQDNRGHTGSKSPPEVTTGGNP